MTNLPSVTIITATYKKFENVYKTIQSVLDQDYMNIEYIITDDGSEIFPENDIRSYIEKNKKNENISITIMHHENWGSVKNLKNAVQNSTGKYVFMLSCGDYFYNDHIVTDIVDIFIKSKSDLIVTSRLMYDLDGNKRCLQPHYFERSLLKRKNTASKQYRFYLSGRIWDMASGSVMYYTRSILEKYGIFDEGYRLLEDAPFLEKYLWENKIYMAYDLISIYYEDGGVSSASGNNVNSIFSNDFNNFKYKQRFDHYKQLDNRTKRILRYSKELHFVKKGIKKYMLYIRYIDVVIPNMLFKAFRNISYKLDSWIIKSKKI